MSVKKIMVDSTNRELCAHGTESFPITVNHDNLLDFEGRNIPIHWHNDLEIVIARSGNATYQIYEKAMSCHRMKSLLSTATPLTAATLLEIPRSILRLSSYVRILCTATLEAISRKTASALFSKIQQFPVLFFLRLM